MGRSVKRREGLGETRGNKDARDALEAHTRSAEGVGPRDAMALKSADARFFAAGDFDMRRM